MTDHPSLFSEDAGQRKGSECGLCGDPVPHSRDYCRDCSRTRGQKHDTPRGAKPCQFGVKDGQGYYGAPVVVDCGKPAVAEWSWGGSKTLFACEEHDAEARSDTPPELPRVTRTTLDTSTAGGN